MFNFLISQYKIKKLSYVRLIFLFKWTGEQEKGNIVQDSRLDTIFFAKQVPLMHLPYTLDIIRCICRTGVRSFGQCCGYVPYSFIRIWIPKVLDLDPEIQNSAYIFINKKFKSSLIFVSLQTVLNSAKVLYVSVLNFIKYAKKITFEDGFSYFFPSKFRRQF